MGTLAELGIDTEQGSVMLIEPPDDVLAEAGRMKPRPSVASSFMHAEPARWLLWWPSRGDLEPGRLERLHWYLSSIEAGEGWIVVAHPDEDDPLEVSDVHAALRGSKLSGGRQRSLGTGEMAVPILVQR